MEQKVTNRASCRRMLSNEPFFMTKIHGNVQRLIKPQLMYGALMYGVQECLSVAVPEELSRVAKDAGSLDIDRHVASDPQLNNIERAGSDRFREYDAFRVDHRSNCLPAGPSEALSGGHGRDGHILVRREGPEIGLG